jgi:hypothetical protein
VSKHIEIRPAKTADLLYVGKNLRQADFEEFVMSTGRHPAKRFARELRGYDDLLCGTADGIPAAIFGCHWGNPGGAPWFLGTEDIEGPQVGRLMVREGRKLFKQWAQIFGTLSNAVYDENHLHKRYIELLGAELSDTVHYVGPFNAPFRKFTFKL